LPLVAKNENQSAYITSIMTNTLTFGLGPAGVGKTFIAATVAADMLRTGMTKKIILTRPAVEAGEELGFLPGTADEKFAPYIRVYLDVLNKRLGRGFVEYALKSGQIEAAPLAYIRGWTLEDAVVLLDEAQNTTPTQMKMFLTRIGERVKVIVNGDADQQDIRGECGLVDGARKARGLNGVGIVEFTSADIVRSGLVQELVQRYAKPTH
jgi:phosphate starvation-inducible PhoH-like protein